MDGGVGMVRRRLARSALAGLAYSQSGAMRVAGLVERVGDAPIAQGQHGKPGERGDSAVASRPAEGRIAFAGKRSASAMRFFAVMSRSMPR